MVDAVKAALEIFRTPLGLSESAAESVAGTLLAAVAARGRCSLALSGGRTPKDTYALLAGRCGDKIPWSLVHLFWGDERCVPPVDPESNFRMASEMLLGRVLIPPQNVHRILGELPPELAAEAYEGVLRAFFHQGPPFPSFDLVLLGAGADGHTASLFPDSPALDEASRWVMAVDAPEGVPCRHRVTLTLPAINASKKAIFLITGVEKRAVVRDLCRAPAIPAATPAGRVCPEREFQVFADIAAAGEGLGGTHP